MDNYYFTDLSHHKGAVDIQRLAAAGHRLVISKASDGYHLPDKDGRYDFSLNRHYDSRFADNFTNTRKAGLIAGAYHFCRWDRPIASKTRIVEANLEYFQTAIDLLPEEYRGVEVAILDMEQSAYQLTAAGLAPLTVSAMARDMVELFAEHYNHLILYSGSWWSDKWLTLETTQWMAERMGVWEPEYVAISNNQPGNPDYKPSVPKGFSNEYATGAHDYIGKLFAWQFTDRGNFFGSANIDTNQYRMPKEELYKLFGQDGAVDPPTVVEKNLPDDLKDLAARMLEMAARLETEA